MVDETNAYEGSGRRGFEGERERAKKKILGQEMKKGFCGKGEKVKGRARVE